MTLDKAYCRELDANITAYKARREFFAQNDTNLRYNFFCPDILCNVEMTGVNIYAVGTVKHRPHFRTKKNCEHSTQCSIVLETNEKNIKTKYKTGNGHGNKEFEYPDEFILDRPKSEMTNKNTSNSNDDDFDIEKRQKRSSTVDVSNASRSHQTSYLENVVDSYEDMSNKESNYITLSGVKRTYASAFKQIKYFTDGKNFIFYGDIEPIKIYGKNYSIKFKDRIWINNKSYRISIYITDVIINNYRLSRLFRESIDSLTSLGDGFKIAKCYFVGSYPIKKEISLQNGDSFTTYEVIIDNLDHLVIKFTE